MFPAISKYTFRNKVYGAIAVIFIVFLFIAHPFGLYFLNDDFIHIPLAASGNFFHSNLLRPVADFTLWLDSLIWGRNPLGFHITNVLIHLLNTFLSFLFFKKIFENAGRVYPVESSCVAAGLFLVYAFHSESVFWIIGRGASLAALFILISLNCYLYSKKTLSLAVSLLSFFVGLFTYEFVWILPAIILLLQVWELHTNRKVQWKWSCCFIATFLVYWMIRANIQHVHVGDYEAASLKNLKLLKLLRNYSSTILRCFLPPFSDSRILLGCGAVASVLGCCCLIWLIKQRQSLLLLVLAFLLLSCLPSISLGIDTHDSEGGRFLYVPSLFVCCFIVDLLFVLLPENALKSAVLSAMMILHSCWLWTYARDYRYAGKVVEDSLSCLSRAEPARTLVATDVPTQFGGALIFRSGFAEAVGWSLPGKYGSVHTVSYSEIFHSRNYRCNCTEEKPPMRETRYIGWTKKGGIVIN